MPVVATWKSIEMTCAAAEILNVFLKEAGQGMIAEVVASLAMEAVDERSRDWAASFVLRLGGRKAH